MKGIETTLGALWVIWLLSWLAAAAWTNPTRSRQSGMARLKHSVFIWAGGILLFAHSTAFGILLRPLYPASPVTDWMALAVVLVGLGWTWWARIHIGRQWSAAVTLKENHALIRTGPYRLTRHPIYTGLLLALLASTLIQDTRAAPLGFLLLVVGFVLKLRQEEQLMRATFGPEYAAYETEVAALIPGVW